MGKKQFQKLDNIEIEKVDIHSSINAIHIDDSNVDNKVISEKFPSGKKTS